MKGYQYSKYLEIRRFYVMGHDVNFTDIFFTILSQQSFELDLIYNFSYINMGKDDIS